MVICSQRTRAFRNRLDGWVTARGKGPNLDASAAT
jgi:hypothetical protein